MKRLLLFVFFLFCISNAFAGAPTVDFTYSPTAPLTTYPIIFTPIIAATPSIDYLSWNWGDGTDTNFFSGGLDFNETFNDLDYTNNPAWIVGSGTWSAASGYLQGGSAGGSLPADIHSPVTMDLNHKKYSVQFRIYRIDNSAQMHIKYATQPVGAPSYNSDGYEFRIGDGASQNWNWGTVIGGTWKTRLSGTTPITNSQWYSIKIEHQTDRNILIYINGDFNKSIVDTNFSDTNTFVISTSGGVGDQRFDDINITTIGLNTTGTMNHTYSTEGNKEVCLTAGNVDANTTNCETITVNGTIRVTLLANYPKDETTLGSLGDYNLTITGGLNQGITTQNSTNQYVFYIPKNVLTTFTFSKENYFSRNYSFITDQNQLLQPYLISLDSGGFYSSLSVIDYYNRFPLSNIIIRSNSVVGSASMEVERNITDSLGKAIFSFILNKTYSLYFDTNEGILIGSVSINAASSTYIFALRSGTIDLNVFTSSPIDYNYMQLGGVRLNNSNQFDFNWTVFSVDKSSIIKTIKWRVFDNFGTVLVNRTISVGAVAVYSDGNTLTYVRPDFNAVLHSVLTVTTVNNVDLNFDPVFFVYLPNETNFAQTAQQIKDLWGNLGATIIVLFVVLGVHGFVADRRPDSNTNGLVFLVAAVSAFFVIFGWIPAGQYAVACLFGLGAWVYSNRGG